MDFSSKLKTIFRSLQYRNYRLFFGGQSISLIGTWMQRIAMPWLVYHLTGSAFLLGLVSFAGQIPTFLLAPLAGVVTDKFSRYRVLLITQVISLLQALILALLSLAGVIQIWHIVVLSIALGCVNAFDVPSRQSFVVEMVEKKEHLGNAIALNSMMFNGARLIGPSIAGLILATAGEGICFLINAVSYIFVVVSLLSMKIQKKEIIRKSGNVLNDMKEGFRYTFGFAPIKHLLILLGIVSLMGSSYQVLMPVFAKEILHGNSSTFGFLMGAAGVGALAGAIFLASRETLIKLGRIIPAASAMFGAGLVVLSFTKYFSVSLLLMIIIGLGLMLQTASSNTILQTITDDDKRGRVMSFYAMALMGTVPIGNLIAGSIASGIGIAGTLLMGGIVTALAGIWFELNRKSLRKHIHPVYVNKGIMTDRPGGLK